MVQEMKRLTDWRARFCAEMDRQRRAAFEWGSHDCSTGLALAAVEAITGRDLRGTWGEYSTAAGAYKAIRKAGFDNLGDLVASIFPEIHPDMARIGDLGLVPADGEIGAGLCVFDVSGVIVLMDSGHGRAPREAVTRAFKVG